MSDHVPFDLVTKILLRLPVAAILRWRGVCKRWQALIDSTEFSKLQLNHSSSTTKNAFLFVLEDDGCGNGDLHFARYINGLRRETIPSFRSNPSPPAQIGVITLIGSCNGLVCFSNDADMAIITNPATQQTHVTPAIPNPLMDLVSIADCVYRYGCGFVYDSVSDDYKVIKLHQMLMLGFDANGEDFHSELVIYGVRSNSSVSVKFPYFLSAEKMGVFVAGAIHWVVHDDRDRGDLVVGFDLGLGECKEIPQPEYRNRKSLKIRIGELENCLCIFANYPGRGVDVWMMKEYGVRESWSIMRSIPHPGLCYDKRIRPLGYSMTGQEILLQLDEKRLVWCDLKKNPPGVDASTEITVNGLKKKKKKNKNKKKYIDAIVCFGSLVSPGGMLPPKEQVKFDKQRKKRDGFLSAGFKLKL
ncbi:unnamed protein product [Linum tenue]|uniref:F-box domain-containing protein n=1 Tax=Linum tenue TaxID=586396 RepID=A0AAV0M2V1_9ROSI|nr:unnamed protein product [Linum tenue]